MKHKYFRCSCHLQDHTLCVSIDDEEIFDNDVVYIETQLSTGPWYLRLWYALGYVILGRNAGWDECILTRNQAKELCNFLEDILP